MATELWGSYTTPAGATLVPYPNAHEYWTHRNGIDVLALFVEALEAGQIQIPADQVPGKNFEILIDMGRPLAPASLVETPEIGTEDWDDFVQRPGHTGLSRVIILEEDPPMISTIVVALAQRYRWEDGEKIFIPNTFQIKTCYIGIPAPNEPWSCEPGSEERKLSLEFWCRHALVWNEAGHGMTMKSTWNQTVNIHDETVNGIVTRP